jgi:nitrogen regulatory protein PII-like uncharacterized protein
MIKNFFTRKPIFQITLTSMPTQEEFETIKKDLRDELGDQYKVIVVVDVHKIHVETKLLK